MFAVAVLTLLERYSACKKVKRSQNGDIIQSNWHGALWRMV